MANTMASSVFSVTAPALGVRTPSPGSSLAPPLAAPCSMGSHTVGSEKTPVVPSLSFARNAQGTPLRSRRRDTISNKRMGARAALDINPSTVPSPPASPRRSKKSLSKSKSSGSLNEDGNVFLRNQPEHENHDPAGQRNLSTVAVILGGGSCNSTSYPLTLQRAKPAVPLGANYRLIDVPISNCINSGVNRMFVLTQFNSLSLNRHLAQAYPPRLIGNWSTQSMVDVLAATQRPWSKEWYKGSADAVRNHLGEITANVERVPDEAPSEYLILSGEHLYRMNYQDLIEQHRASGADVTIGAIRVKADNPALLGRDGAGLGIMKLNEAGKIMDFVEKPKGEKLDELAYQSVGTSEGYPYVASMGIYVFSAKALKNLLWDNPQSNDFGSDIIPAALKSGYNMHARIFTGFWRDISTLRMFYDVNMKLARTPSPFNFYDRKAPIYTVSRNMPPTKLCGACVIEDTLLGEGCYIDNSIVRNSIVGSGTHLGKGYGKRTAWCCF
mmetsp:Transcript_2687/g.9759  ORF Transcript_2687/g.9759 Transcript_2687/m.9759 type:complete len:498 (+) Transcript_2687:245-1738(+)